MPRDPRCPACGEPVGARATDCLHCGAEFETPAGREAADPRADSTDDEGVLDRLLDPEGPLDDSLTVVVAVVVGLVCGFVALLVFGTVAGGAAGLLAAVVAFGGVTAWLGRQYSVFGAVSGGCYALAVALVALPVVVLTDAAEGGTFGGQVLLFVVGEVVLGVVAAALVGVGYAAGKRRPDRADDETDDGDSDAEAAGLGSVVRRE